MRITILGAGYVGLVSGACLADFGHIVSVVDVDPKRVAALSAGKVELFEPGLDALVTANLAAERLNFTTSLVAGLTDAEIIFIAVGTPSRRGDGHADLSYVFKAARDIAPLLQGHVVIATKSTVPVGTGDEVERIMREANPGAVFSVASNPEFLREGAAIGDFKRPDRIVIGTEDKRAEALLAEVYRPLFLNQAPIVNVSRRAAELIKYGANAFLAMKISFINEMADLCEAAGADIRDVARGIGMDNRIGRKFLHAGPGYGGSCFPKDTQALIRTAEELGVDMQLVATTISVNTARKSAMAGRITKVLGGDVTGKTVAILGLTFKPNTDDMREAPSLNIITALQRGGAKVRAYDPAGMAAAAELLPEVTFARDAYDAASGADALVLVTEWDAFRALDFAALRAVMHAPVLVDLRNLYDAQKVGAQGFAYSGIGRRSAL